MRTGFSGFPPGTRVPDFQVPVQRVERAEQAVDDVRSIREHPVGPARVQVGERRLVERRRLHDAPGGQPLDDRLDEAHLRGRQAPIVEVVGEGRLRRAPERLTMETYTS